MDNWPKKKELSIVVPVLNESGIMRRFLENLAGQRDVDFEVIVCDGGSTDETCSMAEDAANGLSFPVKIIHCEKGRGSQMNMGADEAESDILLFLHVDSLFIEEKALRKGIDTLLSFMRNSGNESVAGRFALCFRRSSGHLPLLYFYHESKARLNRSWCIHGDQGFMLPRSMFFSAGSFDESIPVLEDTRFAESVRGMGVWLLLPSVITTSARRFEADGPVRREILNAVIMTLGATGREDFLREMPQIYASRDPSGRLPLYPFFSRIRVLLGGLRMRERISFWYACGSYAASNFWQPAFLFDVRRNYRRGGRPGEEGSGCSGFFGRHADGFIGCFSVRLTACLLVWIFFHLSMSCLFVGERAWKNVTFNRN